MPTISAGALKRMPGLPANVVAGVPRVEKDPRGGDVVIVPVRPYARDMDRCVCFVKFLWAVSAFLLVRLSGCF